jgi:two-component system, OmpR family, sensor histidine kinase SaeS
VRRARIPALVAGVVLAGAVASLGLGAALGVKASELRHMGLLLLIALVATVAATAAVHPLLAHASVRWRFVVIAALAVLVSLVNLGVLTLLMSVSHHDATLVAILLVYSVGAGAAVALALAKAWGTGVERLVEGARLLADGNLDHRIGRIGVGPELDTLAATLDETAASLKRSLARERAGEEKRKDLITAVSHDLRTPLASLRAMVEAVDDRVVEDPPTLRRYADEMRRSVESLSLLVDDLFELVQIDAGAIEAESERVRLDEVVASALATCEPQARAKGLAVEIDISHDRELLCSPRLVRVLQNLLQNAIRHTPADGTVRMEARHGPAGLELVVEDSGDGISPGALQQVFEPFWRGDSARSGDGSGLGLALAKRIVESLGGQIRVQSEPARGSRFAVVVPEGP